MYKLKLNDTVFTMPKKNIVMLALHKAIENGIEYGPIHDDKTAKEYLNSIGIEVYDENGKGN